MQPIYSSASKLVFLILTTTVSLAFLWEVATGRVTLDAKDFMVLVLMAATYYFTHKGDNPNAGNK